MYVRELDIPHTFYPKNRQELISLPILHCGLPFYCFLREPYSRFKSSIITSLTRYKSNIPGDSTADELTPEYYEVLKSLDNNKDEKSLLTLLSLIERDEKKEEVVQIESHLTPMISHLGMFRINDPIIYKDYKEIDSILHKFKLGIGPHMNDLNWAKKDTTTKDVEKIQNIIDNNDSIRSKIKSIYKKDFDLYASKITS